MQMSKFNPCGPLRFYSTGQNFIYLPVIYVDYFEKLIYQLCRSQQMMNQHFRVSYSIINGKVFIINNKMNPQFFTLLLFVPISGR